MTAPRVAAFALLVLLSLGATKAKPGTAKAKPAKSAKPAGYDFSKHLGGVRRSGDLFCFDLPSLALPLGTRVTVVSLSDPQWFADATVGGLCPQSALNAALLNGSPVPAQEIRWTGEPPARFSSGIGILGGARVTMSGNLATADLDGDGKPETFTDCPGGTDGEHLTVWTGEPRTGTRRWHGRVDLGLDLEPACSEAETRP